MEHIFRNWFIMDRNGRVRWDQGGQYALKDHVYDLLCVKGTTRAQVDAFLADMRQSIR